VVGINVTSASAVGENDGNEPSSLGDEVGENDGDEASSLGDDVGEEGE